jgi:hypothetical protein
MPCIEGQTTKSPKAKRTKGQTTIFLLCFSFFAWGRGIPNWLKDIHISRRK